MEKKRIAISAYTQKSISRLLSLMTSIRLFSQYSIFYFLCLLIIAGNTEGATNSEMKTIKVAMCQIFALDGDRSGNFARIEHAVQEAAGAGVEIVCFPETTILGWVNSDAHQRAYPIPGKDTQRLSAIAKQYGVYLCAGLAEKNGDALHDSAVLIDPKGRILLKHRKINILTELMTPPYIPGDTVGAVETPVGKIGILICADTFMDENLNRMAALQPDLVLVPYGWAAEEEKWPDHGKSMANVVSKAAKNIGAPVIGTDLVGAITKGPWAGRVYGGQSVAAYRDGSIQTIAKDRDRDIAIVLISINK